MTIQEFRAWLEGYECSFTDGVPNAEQWEAVKAKMTQVRILPPEPKYGSLEPIRLCDLPWRCC